MARREIRSKNRANGSGRPSVRGAGDRRPLSRRPKDRGGAQVIQMPRNRRPVRPSRKASKAPGKGRRAGRPSGGVGSRRIGIVIGLFACASVLLLGRAVYMNVSDGTSVVDFMASHTLIAEPQVTRGDIVSANGRTLATSVRATRVVATPYQVPEPERASEELSRIVSDDTGQTREDIESLLSATGAGGEPGSYSVISTVAPGTADEVSKLGLEGVYLEPTTERIYPDENLASQVVGNKSDGGTFGGVESRYDERLASGRDVKLTLDTAVQQELQAALQETVEEFDAKNAVGIVMRADDGALVAVANSPTYDNNDFSDSSPEEQRNRAITDPYEPGSTVKPFTFAGAIEENAVSQTDTFSVPDNITVADRVIRDSLPHETEVMTPVDLLAESSNVGTIKVARALGEERVRGYLSEFGFGEATDLGLPGEDPGDLPETRDWSGVSIGNIPIGQGLTTTPLRLATSFSTLVNGGESVRPHILKNDAPAAVEEGREGRVISERTSDIVSGMLQATVDDGTGNRAVIPGYTVGGKTGTSQKVEPETGTYGKDYYASFIGFAPVGDPEYVTLIVVDEPQESIWGESVAAPAFQRVMKFTLGYFNVPPDRPIPAETSPAGTTG